MSVLLIQALDAQSSFWPTTADSWLTLFGALCAAVIFVSTLLWQASRLQTRLEDKINGLGERTNEKFAEQGKRIGNAEVNCAAHGASIEEMQRKDIGMNLELSTNTREITRASAATEANEKNLTQHLREANQTEVKIRERMARIEERLKMPQNKESNNG